MTKISVTAILIATLGLAACAQDQPMTPSRVGAQSSAPDAQALGSTNPGGVGAGNTSTHSNGGGSGGGGATGSGSSGGTGGGQ